jgi:hypothetical protein
MRPNSCPQAASFQVLLNVASACISIDGTSSVVTHVLNGEFKASLSSFAGCPREGKCWVTGCLSEENGEF